jgi:hypothetical protein
MKLIVGIFIYPFIIYAFLYKTIFEWKRSSLSDKIGQIWLAVVLSIVYIAILYYLIK